MFGFFNFSFKPDKEAVKSHIESLQRQLQYEKEQKKRDNEHYAYQIKVTNDKRSKESHRRSKAERAEAHDRRIEELKRQIEREKATLKRLK